MDYKVINLFIHELAASLAVEREVRQDSLD